MGVDMAWSDWEKQKLETSLRRLYLHILRIRIHIHVFQFLVTKWNNFYDFPLASPSKRGQF